MKAKSIRLSDDLAQRLQERAKEEERTETAIIRDAIERYLEPDNQPINKAEMVAMLNELARRIETIQAEALPQPQAKKSFWKRLISGD